MCEQVKCVCGSEWPEGVARELAGWIDGRLMYCIQCEVSCAECGEDLSRDVAIRDNSGRYYCNADHRLTHLEQENHDLAEAIKTLVARIREELDATEHKARL